MLGESAPTDELILAPRRSRLGSLLGVEVLSVGGYVPEIAVTNQDLAERGFDADWIVQRTGILERRHAPPGWATSHMAVEAARQCIARADIEPHEIDLVLVATYTPDMPMPSTAALVQDSLGVDALAFDLQAACAGFVFGLLTGMQYVATGCSRLALVIGADCNSRIVDPGNPQVYPLFGDGAGAVLLARGTKQQGMLAYAVGSDGSGADLLSRPMGGSRLPFPQHRDDPRRWLHMSGRPVFKWAVRTLGQSIREALAYAGVVLDEIKLVVLHQANLRIIEAARKDLGIEPGRMLNNLQRYGNTAAASIPLALEEAHQQGRIQRGDLVLVSGFGGGLAWGTALIRW